MNFLVPAGMIVLKKVMILSEKMNRGSKDDMNDILQMERKISSDRVNVETGKNNISILI